MGSATELEYLKDTYNLSLDALVLEIGESFKGKFIVFNKTIFYPKGGGQPSDIGKIITSIGLEISIKLVLFDPMTGIVQHYTDDAESLDLSLVNTKVQLAVDMTSRLLNAKAHTSGHLLDALVSDAANELKGKIGCHDPIEGCYVKFQGLLTSSTNESLKDRLNEMLQAVLSEQREVSHRIVDPTELSDLLVSRR